MSDLDVIIAGGGVMGLLLLRRVVDLGYSALLVEAKELGCGQSLHAQAYLTRGLVYAPYELRGRTSGVFNGNFSRGADEWELLLHPLGISPRTPAYHLVHDEELNDVLESWDAARLIYIPVNTRPPDIGTAGTVFRCDEVWIADGNAAFSKLSCAPYEQWIHQGTVTDVDLASTSVTIKPHGGVPVALRARTVVFAGIPPLVPELAPRSALKAVALVVEGLHLPRYAVTFRPKFVDGMQTRFLDVMAVPRWIDGDDEPSAFVCTTAIPLGQSKWEASMARAFCTLFPKLRPGELTFDSYEQTFWPSFDATSTFQIVSAKTNPAVIAVYPVRLTLAPVAAEAVVLRISAILGDPQPMSAAARAFRPGFPGFAQEKWRGSRRRSFQQLL